MKSVFLFCFLLLLALLSACQNAEPPVATSEEQAPVGSAEPQAEPLSLPTVPGDGIDQERYAEHLARLASDEFEGRAPGTAGERLTLDYLVGQFAELGLQPGWRGSYLQPVPMVELTNIERSDLIVTSADGPSDRLVYPEQMIIGSRRQGPGALEVTDSELVFVGYGIVAPEYGWDDYRGLDVRGKTVVMLVNDPGYESADPERFNGRAMTYYGRWTYKYEEAARQGAAAALIVHETEPASYGWDVVINSWSGAQFELAEATDEPLLMLEGWLSRAAADGLFARAGLDFAAEKERAGGAEFTAQSLGLRVSGRVTNSIRTGLSHNVLATIPGVERPDEAVIYLGHWDHLGRNLALPGSTGIYNGAVDNASGVAGLLEIARLFKQAGPPPRSVLFLAVTLEEYGLLGSRHYVANPAFPTASTVAAINMDAMTLLGPTNDVTVIGYGASELEDLLARVAARQGRRLEREPTPEAGYFYRSDHFNFAKAGIPALYVKGGVEHREEGREYGMNWNASYRAERYHKPADTFDPETDLRGVIEDLEMLYVVGRHLTEGEDWPDWFEGNEFRAIRRADRKPGE